MFVDMPFYDRFCIIAKTSPDVKGENLMVGEQKQAKGDWPVPNRSAHVIDFGLAKAMATET